MQLNKYCGEEFVNIKACLHSPQISLHPEQACRRRRPNELLKTTFGALNFNPLRKKHNPVFLRPQSIPLMCVLKIIHLKYVSEEHLPASEKHQNHIAFSEYVWINESIHNLCRKKDSLLVTKREIQRKISTVYIYVPPPGCGKYNNK